MTLRAETVRFGWVPFLVCVPILLEQAQLVQRLRRRSGPRHPRRARVPRSARPSQRRVTRAETIHLTLAFHGEVRNDRLDELITCVRRVRGAPFGLQLDSARHWAHNGIVWAGPRETPDALRELAAQLNTALKADGFRTERRAFKAHVTLARRSERAAMLPPLEPLPWRAEEFVLVRSELSPAGPAYATLSRFALDGVPW